MHKKKRCKYCNKLRPETHFGVALTTATKVYRRRKCRDCYRETKKDLQQRIKAWVREYKEQHPCVRCGFDDYRALVFHHPNGDKEFNVGDAIFMSFKRVKVEAAKCAAVCRNCHAIIHSEH